MNAGTLVETVGLIAATLTTVSFFPQVIKTWRSGGEGLSYGMLLTFFVGSTLWLVYGLALGSSPVIFANALTALQVLAVVVLKARRTVSI